jgi:predicted signal transduction protein with EAL and GGDEF domain
MLLRNKVILLLNLILFIFLIFVSIDTINTSWTYFTISSISLITLFFLAIDIFIIKRLAKLKSQLIITNIKQENAPPLLTINGDDEIAEITSQINKLMSDAHEMNDETEKKLTKQANELKNQISYLHKELLIHQVNEKKQINSRECLTQLARYDSLTALPNRIFFNEILNKALSHAKRRSKLLALLYINLDNFKK